MSDPYIVKLIEPVRASDPLEAASEAIRAIRSGEVSFSMIDAQGAEVVVSLGGGEHPLFKVVGLDAIQTVQTVVIAAEDSYAAQEYAAGYGLSSILFVKETLIPEDEEIGLSFFLDGAGDQLGQTIALDTSSFWNGNGVIRFHDENGAMMMHSFRFRDTPNSRSLLAETKRQVEQQVVEALLSAGKTITSGSQKGLALTGENLTIFVDGATGKVTGWKINSLIAYRQACDILLVDVFSSLSFETEEELANFNYWNHEGRFIKAHIRS